MSNLVIKSTYNGDLRRFTITPGAGAFSNIRSQAASLYELQAHQLCLRYRDNEGDLITITNDEDLTESTNSGCTTPRGVLLRLEISMQETSIDTMPSIIAPSQQTAKPSVPPLMLGFSPETAEEVVLKPQPALEVHVGIWCDTCNTHPIRGIRYSKQLKHDTFDLCQACYDVLSDEEKAELDPQTAKPSPAGTFDTLLHIPTGEVIQVTGATLQNGFAVFKLEGEKNNVSMGPKGKVSNNGGEGGWAQWSLNQSSDGHMCLTNKGNSAQGWCLDLNLENMALTRCDEPGYAPWLLQCQGSSFVPAPPAEWYAAKMAAKSQKKAEKAAQRGEAGGKVKVKAGAKKHSNAAEEIDSICEEVVLMDADGVDAKAPSMEAKAEASGDGGKSEPAEQVDHGVALSTISVAGNIDGRPVHTGSHLAIHASNKTDVMDKNAVWAMTTAEAPKASLWSLQQGGWIPQGLVALTVAGNVDGRATAQGWSLMVAQDKKAPHKRDATSAYVIATEPCMGKKAGLWAIEAWEQDPSKCLLKYAGNRDGRDAAKGWYLAVHASRFTDHRDVMSSYALVTKDVRKASLWDIRPYWGAVPPPPPRKLVLDAAGNPKIGFHTAKKVAIPSVMRAILNLGSAPPLGTAVLTTAPTTESAAAAALHSLRVAAEWIRKKTGLPITIAEISNKDALAAVEKLRALPHGLPKWMDKEGNMPGDATARVDAMVSQLAEEMQKLWQSELNDVGQSLAKGKGAEENHKTASKAEKEAAKAAARAEKEAAKAAIEVQKEAAKAENQAAKAAAKAEKEAAKAEKEAAKAEKEAAKAAKKAEKKAVKAVIKAEKEPAKDAIETEQEAAEPPPSATMPENAHLIQQLNNMGFGNPHASHALAAANGDLEAALEILLSSDQTMLDGDGEELPPAYRPPTARSTDEIWK